MKKYISIYTTSLNKNQIQSTLQQLCDKNTLIWRKKKNNFVVKARSYTNAFAKIPINVKRKGEMIFQSNETIIKLFISPVMSIKDILIFTIPTFLILLFKGIEFGVKIETIIITLILLTIFAFFITNLFTRFTNKGTEMYSSTVEFLVRILELKLN